jgi:hypothetical protein
MLAGVVAAEAIARPGPAAAANGGSVILGDINIESTSTAIDNSRDGDTALNCNSTGAGIGLSAISPSGPGVRGIGGTGVVGISPSGEGVYGQSGRPTSGFSSVGSGVHGITDSASGIGVIGENTGGSTGVAGTSSGGGDGVTGTSDDGRGVVGMTGSGRGVFGQRGGTGPVQTPVDQHGVHGVTDSPLGHAVYGEHVGVGTAVAGSSKLGGTAVAGTAAGGGAGGSFSSDTNVGAQGSSGTGKGLWGITGSAGTKFLTSANGVHGLTSSTPDSAVLGEHAAGGPGVTGITGGTAAAVHGSNTGSGGTGVHGDCPAGTGVRATGMTALDVTGPAVFSRSGKLTIKAGHTSATKTGLTLTAASLILATPQNDVTGAAIRSAVPNAKAGSFTVHLVKPVTGQVTIAWFIVN